MLNDLQFAESNNKTHHIASLFAITPACTTWPPHEEIWTRIPRQGHVRKLCGVNAGALITCRYPLLSPRMSRERDDRLMSDAWRSVSGPCVWNVCFKALAVTGARGRNVDAKAACSLGSGSVQLSRTQTVNPKLNTPHIHWLKFGPTWFWAKGACESLIWSSLQTGSGFCGVACWNSSTRCSQTQCWSETSAAHSESSREARVGWKDATRSKKKNA